MDRVVGKVVALVLVLGLMALVLEPRGEPPLWILFVATFGCVWALYVAGFAIGRIILLSPHYALTPLFLIWIPLLIWHREAEPAPVRFWAVAAVGTFLGLWAAAAISGRWHERHAPRGPE